MGSREGAEGAERDAVTAITDRLERRSIVVLLQSGEIDEMIIKSGTVSFHKDAHPTMMGAGDRKFTDFIRFDSHFRKAPTVSVSVRGFDIIHNANARVALLVADVSHDGFELTLHTWADTQIWSLEVSWMAYGDR